MNIDLTKLVTNNVSDIELNIDVEFPNDYYKEDEIRNLKDTCFKGNITKSVDGNYVITGVISGIMVIPDNITLEDVDYKFSAEIEEEFSDFDNNFDNNLKIMQNSLDITEFLWQNILVEIPLKVVSEKNKDLKLEGNGWRLTTEDELNSNKYSPFSELQENEFSGKE